MQTAIDKTTRAVRLIENASQAHTPEMGNPLGDDLDKLASLVVAIGEVSAAITTDKGSQQEQLLRLRRNLVDLGAQSLAWIEALEYLLDGPE